MNTELTPLGKYELVNNPHSGENTVSHQIITCTLTYVIVLQMDLQAHQHQRQGRLVEQ